MKCLALLLALPLLYGCDAISQGNLPVTQSFIPSSSIVVMPATAKIRIGDAHQFSAAFSGLPVPPDCVDGAGHNRTDESQFEGPQPRPCTILAGGMNPGVTWSVNGVPGGNAILGTIDARGLYTAPANLPNPNSVNVTATSAENPSVSSWAPVTLDNPIPTLTSVSPATVSLGSFTLTVTGRKLVKGAEVIFAGAPLQTTFNSATQLTATGIATQAQLGTVQVSVINPDPGPASSIADLSVQVNKPPAIQVSLGPPTISRSMRCCRGG